MMAHHCHATSCSVNVPPEMFMCKKHWFSLPASMRRLVWNGYRVGQCDDMNPSMEYCLIAKRCIEYIAKQEEIEADTKLYDFFLREQEEQ